MGAAAIVLYACCGLNRSGLSNSVSSRKFECSTIGVAIIGICVLAQLSLILLIGDIYHVGTGVIDVMALQ